jgi:hypothetical protein
MVLSNSRLGFLTVKRIDLTSHEHICQYKVLKYLNALRGARLIIVPECLKEVFISAIPLAFAHPHFSATLFDNTHNARVWDGRTDLLGRIVDLLEFLGVTHFVMHLNLECVYLKELRPTLGLILDVGCFDGPVKVLDKLLIIN